MTTHLCRESRNVLTVPISSDQLGDSGGEDNVTPTSQGIQNLTVSNNTGGYWEYRTYPSLTMQVGTRFVGWISDIIL